MRSAIIIGASSGIGKELARTLARDGYSIGLAARRVALLQDIARDIHTRTFVKMIDVSQPVEAMQSLAVNVTRRWRIVVWLAKVLPDWLVHRL